MADIVITHVGWCMSMWVLEYAMIYEDKPTPCPMEGCHCEQAWDDMECPWHILMGFSSSDEAGIVEHGMTELRRHRTTRTDPKTIWRLRNTQTGDILIADIL